MNREVLLKLRDIAAPLTHDDMTWVDSCVIGKAVRAGIFPQDARSGTFDYDPDVIASLLDLLHDVVVDLFRGWDLHRIPRTGMDVVRDIDALLAT